MSRREECGCGHDVATHFLERYVVHRDDATTDVREWRANCLARACECRRYEERKP